MLQALEGNIWGNGLRSSTHRGMAAISTFVRGSPSSTRGHRCEWRHPRVPTDGPALGGSACSTPY